MIEYHPASVQEADCFARTARGYSDAAWFLVWWLAWCLNFTLELRRNQGNTHQNAHHRGLWRPPNSQTNRLDLHRISKLHSKIPRPNFAYQLHKFHEPRHINLHTNIKKVPKWKLDAQDDRTHQSITNLSLLKILHPTLIFQPKPQSNHLRVPAFISHSQTKHLQTYRIIYTQVQQLWRAVL
jgi:hypothetical protein